MLFFKNMKIPTKLFFGFGATLFLLLIISGVSIYNLVNADVNFKNYRALARQTNADGRVQANMLLTRIFAKNFVISANAENINDVNIRAQRTIEMISEAKLLSHRDGYKLVIDDLDKSLREYVAQFKFVTTKQKIRDLLVKDTLNVVGPDMEKNLTLIMESAFSDDDAEAAYRAGLTLRSLLLARLYAARFLIQNDNLSYKRVLKEFNDMTDNRGLLVAILENPERVELAQNLKIMQHKYEEAFVNVYDIIISRNNIISTQLDRIGPDVANQVENLKLAIKAEQDTLGPKAEAEINWAVLTTIIVSITAVIAATIYAWIIAKGISTPIISMTGQMKNVASGNLDEEIRELERTDEVGEMARAIEIFKRNAIEKNLSDLALNDAFGVITDSIAYASRIQRSILPEPRFLHLRFVDHFVLWEPRDIVGGDIYGCLSWGEGTVIVVVDCTGHGVPGAFMTLIAMGALERALSDVDVGDVGKLIQTVHRLVQFTLNQENEGGDSNDGLEMGACYIHPDNKKLVFSGARLNLYTALGNDISTIKGTNALVGYRGIPETQEFKSVEIDVKNEMAFYLVTDGLVDQVGGIRSRMFGKKRLVKLLSSTNGQRMADQKEGILKTLIDYQGQQKRRDDVTVVGFKMGETI